MTTDHFDQLDLLLFDWEAGTLDDSGVERLREILRSDEAARKHFAKAQVLTAALHLEGDTGVVDIPANAPPASTPKKQATRFSSWLLVAGLLIAALAARVLFLEFRSSTPDVVATADEVTADGIAIATRVVDAKWQNQQSALRTGDAILPGRLSLQSGFVQIEFFCGATVIVEGPAELELESATLARIHSGRLRAQVPPAARGFTVLAGDVKVVDLGTEFGISMSNESASLQVFDGEVELHGESETKRSLTTGQGVAWSESGQFEETAVDPNSFVDVSNLESLAKDQRDGRYRRWKDWSETLREDTRLIALHTFEKHEVGNRRLRSSVRPTNGELDGAIVGASQTAGRWPEKTALEFKRPADRVRVQIPGEFGSLSFAAWVRIDSLDRRFNSLFLTDNYNKGEPHWQILESGQLYFSVRPVARGKPGPRDFKALSEPFWNPLLSGQWLHLATVYDVESKRIVHYLNGQELSRHSIPRDQVAESTRIGTASIGNWSAPTQPDERFAIRNLNGRIDEFALFNAALSADEISKMYENGRP